MPNKVKKITRGKQIKPDSSWGKETMRFKVEKKKYKRTTRDRIPCEGELCKKKSKENKAYVFKGEECADCHNHHFNSLRYSPQSPYFDNEFLTRLELV